MKNKEEMNHKYRNNRCTIMGWAITLGNNMISMSIVWVCRIRTTAHLIGNMGCSQLVKRCPQCTDRFSKTTTSKSKNSSSNSDLSKNKSTFCSSPTRAYHPTATKSNKNIMRTHRSTSKTTSSSTVSYRKLFWRQWSKDCYWMKTITRSYRSVDKYGWSRVWSIIRR